MVPHAKSMAIFSKGSTSLGFSRGGNFRRVSLVQGVQCAIGDTSSVFPPVSPAGLPWAVLPSSAGSASSLWPLSAAPCTHTPRSCTPRVLPLPPWVQSCPPCGPTCLPGTAAAGNTDPARKRCCCKVAQMYFCEGDCPTCGIGL